MKTSQIANSKRLGVFFLCFILFGSCHAQKQTAFLDELVNESVFSNLAGHPLTRKYSDVQSLKVVYAIETNELYFINSTFYTFHFEFCQAVLDPFLSLEAFNADNYAAASTNRRFLLGNINHYGQLGKYALELSPSDLMSVEQIQKLMEKIKANSFVGDALCLMLNTQRLTNLKTQFPAATRFLTQEEIYANMTSQIIVTGEAIGQLRVVTDLQKEMSSLKPTDIIVLQETPQQLPHVGGVIVSEFQTPLSHLTLLAQNRGIPVLALKNVFGRDSILNLAGRTVEFVVRDNLWVLKATNKKEKGRNVAKNRVQLKYDLTVKSLLEVRYLNDNSERFVGNKANNLGLLYDISMSAHFKTPESAFAIPFYFYAEHMKVSGVQLKINALLASPQVFLDPVELEQDLKAIRSGIHQAEVNPALIKAVEEKILAMGKHTRMRFRSSTNAEDERGFSGAGLYASATGELGNSEKSIERAIKKVWASLWTLAAYSERNYFNIDQATVQMGILVHRSFPDEEVNGVIITKNVYRKHYLGFVVNAQLGGESVVQPKPAVRCDQFICYPKSNKNIQRDEIVVDIIGYSSLNNGVLVMTEEEIQHLADEVDKIKLKLYRKMGRRFVYEDFGLDLEFKLDAKTRQLYIKQVRLYND